MNLHGPSQGFTFLLNAEQKGTRREFYPINRPIGYAQNLSTYSSPLEINTDTYYAPIKKRGKEEEDKQKSR